MYFISTWTTMVTVRKMRNRTGIPVQSDAPSLPIGRLSRVRPVASQENSGWATTPTGLPPGAIRKASPP